jgi:hypothetical protein
VPGVRNQYFFADIPQWDPGTLNVEQRMRMLSDKYFGRQTKDADPSIAPALRQMLMDGWLEGWRQAITQIYQLAQQFLPNEFYYRVIGNKNAKPVRASREEIQGKFDVRIGFNVGDLNPEELQAKLEAIKTVVSELDVNGIIDRDELVAIVFEWIDPNLGERLIKPGESASQQEIEDEQNVFAQISAGVDVDIKPGQAYQLRLQTLQQILSAQDDKGKPRNKDVMDRLQKDESFRARIEKRVQQLQHQLEQRENAKIGRLGA